jgi:hypothetical protein
VRRLPQGGYGCAPQAEAGQRPRVAKAGAVDPRLLRLPLPFLPVRGVPSGECEVSSRVVRAARASDERNGGLSALVRLVPARRRARRLDRLLVLRDSHRRQQEALGDRHRFGLVRRRLPALVLLGVLLAGGVGTAQARYPSPPHWWLAGPGACIRTWESGNGRTSANLYGMLDGWSCGGRQPDMLARMPPSGEQGLSRVPSSGKRYGWEPWRGQTASRCGLRALPSGSDVNGTNCSEFADCGEARDARAAARTRTRLRSSGELS